MLTLDSAARECAGWTWGQGVFNTLPGWHLTCTPDACRGVARCLTRSRIPWIRLAVRARHRFRHRALHRRRGGTHRQTLRNENGKGRENRRINRSCPAELNDGDTTRYSARDHYRGGADTDPSAVVVW